MNNDAIKLFGLFRILNDDVQASVTKLNGCHQDEFDFYTRSYLRAFASWVEGSVWIYKQVIGKLQPSWINDLPTELQLYIYEYDWKIKSNGIPVIQQKKIKTKENLKGFFYVMGEIFDGFSVETSGVGWSNLMCFYRIRDKMMHPTNNESLKVERDELQKCESGRRWLEDVFQNLRDNIYAKTK